MDGTTLGGQIYDSMKCHYNRVGDSKIESASQQPFFLYFV